MGGGRLAIKNMSHPKLYQVAQIKARAPALIMAGGREPIKARIAQWEPSTVTRYTLLHCLIQCYTVLYCVTPITLCYTVGTSHCHPLYCLIQ